MSDWKSRRHLISSQLAITSTIGAKFYAIVTSNTTNFRHEFYNIEHGIFVFPFWKFRHLKISTICFLVLSSYNFSSNSIIQYFCDLILQWQDLRSDIQSERIPFSCDVDRFDPFMRREFSWHLIYVQTAISSTFGYRFYVNLTRDAWNFKTGKTDMGVKIRAMSAQFQTTSNKPLTQLGQSFCCRLKSYKEKFQFIQD